MSLRRAVLAVVGNTQMLGRLLPCSKLLLVFADRKTVPESPALGRGTKVQRKMQLLQKQIRTCEEAELPAQPCTGSSSRSSSGMDLSVQQCPCPTSSAL